MNTEELNACLTFIQHAGQLKDTLRSGHTIKGRQESTAEHTWRLCLLAMIFERELSDTVSVDFAQLLKIAIIHDLGEAISGDIPAVEQVPGVSKSASERADLQTLLEPLDTQRQAEILELWDDYEHARSIEARLVKGLDKLETIITHNQGENPPDFDYAFNLDYGQAYMQAHPLFKQIRAQLDEETQANEGKANPATSKR